MSGATLRQAEALKRIWATANRDHGASRVCAVFLLSLYNGNRFKLDLTDLRLLDAQHWTDCMELLAMDDRPQAEVHVILRDVLGQSYHYGPEFERLAFDWRVPGRTKKDQLPALPLREVRYAVETVREALA